MRLAATTLGCPNWSIGTILDKIPKYGFDGIDFRGLKNNLDITKRPEFTDRLDWLSANLDKKEITISALSSSIAICEPASRRDNVNRAQRLIPIAHALDIEYIRVFGKGNTDQQSIGDVAEVGRTTMNEILSLEGATDIQWIVETHDNWTSSKNCLTLIEQIDSTNVGALWDVGHTTRVSEEDPTETLATLGSHIQYVHLKDAVYEPDHDYAMDDGWRYVTPGTGQLPLAAAVDSLRDQDYGGWVLFEHEKRWHPELSNPAYANPSFIRWFSKI